MLCFVSLVFFLIFFVLSQNRNIGPNVGSNIPTPVAQFGPFQPQPTPYNASFSYLNETGPFAAEISVVADGVSAYQLLVRADCTGVPGNGKVRM